MLKKLSENKEFLRIINKFLENPEILDVILFGSIVKGKEKPRDIDILVVYSNEIKDISEKIYILKKSLEKIYKNIEITPKRYNEVFKPEFIARESIISEGYSMRNKKFFLEALGYKNMVLFKYSLKNMNKSERMRFYYSLYGRGNEKGILEKNNCYKFSDGVIISPIGSSEAIRIFLKSWNIENLDFSIAIPERIVRYKFLKNNKR
jgi:predicted nucleotidyltransferase